MARAGPGAAGGAGGDAGGGPPVLGGEGRGAAGPRGMGEAAGGSVAPGAARPGGGPAPTAAIDHVVVIYLENHSFDNLYGLFPGADGLANAQDALPQVDLDGRPYAALPQPVNTSQQPHGPDPRFPADLPNQ